MQNKGEPVLTPRHSSKAFLEAHPPRTMELVEADKS